MVGGGGGSSTKSTIIVSIDTGSTVAAYSDSSYTTLVKTASEKSTGEYWITGLNNGTYYIKATKGTDTATESYTITEYGVYRITMSYATVPEFTYTGSYEVVHDDDTPIPDITTYNEANWKIRFLTSGTLTFTSLNGAADGIDVFLVGGGGGGYTGGGGGGYTTTALGVSIASETSYLVTVGSGGANHSAGSQGGTSSAFGQTANGGHAPATSVEGGAGGSGGGGYGQSKNGGAGGSDGGNGGAGSNTSGIGQGTTTREFGENTGTLYAGGGGGGAASSYTAGAGGSGGGGAGNKTNNTAGSGTANTGGGGGGSGSANLSGAGGSGIVIIRNARS